MIRAAAAVAACLLLIPAPAPAAPAPDVASEAGPKLGEPIKVGEETLVPGAAIDLPLLQKPEPGIYRHIAPSWDRPAGAAFYPAAAFASRQTGEVFVTLTVDAEGKPVACRITKPSGIAALDEHSCGHALSRTAFYPGLDDRGGRFGGTVEARISYNLHNVMLPKLIGDTSWTWPPRWSAPLQPITLDTLGIPADTKLQRRIDTLRGMVSTDAEGSVTACLLTYPTFDDVLDKRICDRLRELRFKPALDRQQRPTAGFHGFEVPLPR